MGIVYAGFLENGPEKRILGPTGELQPTGERETFKVQPMDEASRAIIRTIERRKERIVLSTMGKSLYFVLRFAPWLPRLIMRRGLKKARNIYDSRSAT